MLLLGIKRGHGAVACLLETIITAYKFGWQSVSQLSIAVNTFSEHKLEQHFCQLKFCRTNVDTGEQELQNRIAGKLGAGINVGESLLTSLGFAPVITEF